MDTEKKLAEALRQSIAALSMASLYVDGEAGADESAQVSEAVAGARAALAEYDAAAREPAHEEMRALVVSTAHVTQAEAERIDDGDLPEFLHTPWAHPEFGWIFWIADEPQAGEVELSDGFRQVIAYARAHGLKWVRFDRDGDELPGLVTYEW